jgi:serine protease
LLSTFSIRRLTAPAVSALVLACAGAALPPGSARGAEHAPGSAAYVPGEVVVGYQQGPLANAAVAFAARLGRSVVPAPEAGVEVLRLPRGVTVSDAIASLRGKPGIAYAVPNFVAHAAGDWYPNDTGRGRGARGWEAMQWNFLAAAGVNAPEAWANLIADRRPGARGVVIAILDTGVAYRDWHQFSKAPDFGGTRFVSPYDFVARNRYPLDREGHGTFVAGTIAETTNNRIGLAGLAYGASIMPVRILDEDGYGDAATISRGIRYAVQHGAQVINLSLEFDPDTTAGDIPDIISALQFAYRHGVVVVAASGNEGSDQVAYPARASTVISVGATTSDRCLAEYSNTGPGLDLVAPGGGDDTSLLADADCHPERNLPGIWQMTLLNPPNWRRFGYPSGIYGTSMAAPHVAAAAAMVIASGVLGRRPTPSRIRERLEQTAATLGGSKPNAAYGYGLLDVGAATSRA